MQKNETVEPEQGRTVDISGQRTHLLEDGPPSTSSVLLLHGCGSLAQEVIAPFRNVGLRIIAPDRPGYGFSSPLQDDERGPLGQSRWLEQLIAGLELQPVVIAAHSIASASALLLRQRRPDLVKSLFLISPFCRPTPEKAMPLLRLSVMPYIGPLVHRHVVWRFAKFLGARAMKSAHRPNPVPVDLVSFPYHHAASEQALRTIADELLSFNADMSTAETCYDGTTYILHGAADSVAEPCWHLPWLRQRVPNSKLTLLQRVGHTPHHAASQIARSLLLQASDRGGQL